MDCDLQITEEVSWGVTGDKGAGQEEVVVEGKGRGGEVGVGAGRRRGINRRLSFVQTRSTRGQGEALSPPFLTARHCHTCGRARGSDASQTYNLFGSSAVSGRGLLSVLLTVQIGFGMSQS